LVSVQPATFRPVATPRHAVKFKKRTVGPTWLTAVGEFARRKPLGAFGAAIVVLMLVLAIGAQWLAPYPYDVGVTADRLQGPTLSHPFVTDANGRDLLSRIIWRARIAVTIAFAAMLLSTQIAVRVGSATCD